MSRPHTREKGKRVGVAGIRNWRTLIFAIELAFGSITVLGFQTAFAADSLKAGSPPTSAPMTFLDVRTNTIEGVMPDIIREIGKREGFALTFDAIPFPALIQSAVSGKIDIIVSAMTPTTKRAEVVDFADVVYSFGEGLLLPDADTNAYKSANDLKGKTIGTLAGTTYSEALGKLGIYREVKYYDTTPDLLNDLANGRVDAGFDDAPLLAGLEMNGKLKGLHIDHSYTPLLTGGIAIAVRKGNKPLLDKINAGVASIKADGTLDVILKKWHLK